MERDGTGWNAHRGMSEDSTAEQHGLVEVIRGLAAERPSAPALQGPGGPLDRAGLERLRAGVAARIGEHLAADGAGGAEGAGGADGGTVVAVLASRTTALPAALLGVLSSGARWLLLDPAHPSHRLARLAAAARARLLLVCPGVPVSAALSGLPTVRVDDADSHPREPHVPAPRRGYLMATSGTTGEPALVSTGEQPLAHFLARYTECFGLGPDDATAVLAGLAHDALLRDLFAPLVVGGRACVPDQVLLRDPEGLIRWLQDMRVTVVHLTPQLGRLLASTGGRLPGVRLAVLAGDTLTAADVRRLRALAPVAQIVNGYGTTETPQLPSYQVVTGTADGDSARPMPVGAGVDGNRLVVLTGGGVRAAVGELGEVVVHSRYLADGYLPGAGRTGPDGEPLFTRPGASPDPAQRSYRTGDLGRHGSDGSVTLAGRTDHQLKVRGHRIEAAEVEAALRAHPEVVDAVVLGRPDRSGETALVAHVVLAPAESASARTGEDQLRRWLAGRLPEHAVPATVLLRSRLPLTSGGKVDREALLHPPAAADPGDGGPDPAAPTERGGRTTQQLVVGVWREVLGLARIGLDDNFFALGGHSLSLVAVHARLAPLVRGDLQVVDLFRYPTVRALARRLDGVPGVPGLDRAARRIAARRTAAPRAAARTQQEAP